jgi:N-acyl-D-aspartate/D-glutamate deacylase
MNRAGGGLFQAIMDFETRASHDFGLLGRMAEVAGDVLFTAGPGNAGDGRVAEMWDGFLTTTRAERGRITAICGTRPGGMLLGLVHVSPVKGRRWAEVMALPTVADRLDALRDDTTRAELVEEGRRKGLCHDAATVYPLGDGELPDYRIDGTGSVAELAAAAGVDPVELVIDRLLESEGRELFNSWLFYRNLEGLAGLLEVEHVYPGAADTGAHAGMICDADATTHYLAHWSRDRGVRPFADAVRRLTSQPAGVLGLRDRGTVVAGAFADLNVFDPARLSCGYPEYVRDFPGGTGRLCVGSTGYAATLVNGVVVAEEGANTGARPGRVLREFARS